MGFSLAAATAIIGVAILISVELMVGTTIPTIEDVHESYDDMRDRSIDQLQTAINITSYSTKSNASLHDLNIDVENTGSTTLDVSHFTVLINGTNKPFTSTTGYLHPQNTAEIIVLALDGTVTNQIKIVTDNGISDYYEYAVP